MYKCIFGVLFSIVSVLVFGADMSNKSTESNSEFIHQLKYENSYVRTRLKTSWHVNYNELYTAMKNRNTHSPIVVDKAILNYASGVNDQNTVWKFSDTRLNDDIADLFKTISLNEKLLGFPVSLTQYDLFHGHIFAVYAVKNTISDIGILFHAKEFPRDLHLGNPDAEKNSPFTTLSHGYDYRNFIWLASTSLIYDLDSKSNAIFPAYFIPSDLDAQDPSMQEIVRQYLQAKTFLIDNLLPDVELLGDVNCFVSNERLLIFFTY